MPVQIGNLWFISYTYDEGDFSTIPADVDTAEGREALHASIDDALSSGTTVITVSKSA